MTDTHKQSGVSAVLYSLGFDFILRMADRMPPYRSKGGRPHKLTPEEEAEERRRAFLATLPPMPLDEVYPQRVLQSSAFPLTRKLKITFGGIGLSRAYAVLRTFNLSTAFGLLPSLGIVHPQAGRPLFDSEAQALENIRNPAFSYLARQQQWVRFNGWGS